MPQHVQARSWGTRFDTLLFASLPPAEDANVTPQEDSPLTVNEPSDDSKKSADKIVQDASIFIGSLPTNIEHLELTRMLSDHLSDHPEVQTIKVVRDSKGGTCAFIQCQDAETAAMLITHLHSSVPKQFMGRYLRYEPARALRTLLISYRTPRQFAPPSDTKSGFGDLQGGEPVDLDLPWAMKISRVPGSRHLSVLYNSDARAAAENEGLLPLSDREADESGAYFYPLLYTAETLRKISTIFGGIEHFVPHEFESGVQQEYPPPHNAPRSVEMETGCWEIKWCHRDDCVGALMTLRRVPHLTVTWAHHPAHPRQSMSHHGAQPVHTTQHHWQAQVTSSTHTVPSHFPFPNRFSSADSLVPYHRGIEQTPSSVSLGDISRNLNRASTALCDMAWSSQNVALDTKGTTPKRPRALSLSHKPSGVDKKDFPPISETVRERETRKYWSDRMEADENPSIVTPLSSMTGISDVASSTAHFNTTPVHQEGSYELEVGIPPTPEFGSSPMTPKTPVSLVPRTPTTGSYLGDFHSGSLPELATKNVLQWDAKREGPLDPTTIFVGGLEMYGPNAWDEERVRNLFSRYGGVENVKVIRPVNKRSAFAFVTFNNKDSPARAVSEEHNRILDGRPIRVQLRDWNPPHRTNWRSNRNRVRNYEGSIVRHGSEPSLVSSDDFRVDPNLQQATAIALEERLQELNIGQTAAKASLPDVQQSEENLDVTSELQQTSSPVADDVQAVNLDDTVPPQAASITPSTSQSSVTSVPPQHVAYPVPTMGYYHPQGWVAGFPPYHMQYMGAYPGYPLPSPMGQSFPPASGADARGTPSATPAPIVHPGMYAPFIPYPYPATTPVREQGQGQTPVAAQAPLIPTGFIHGDQGILVPVYPPDALDQYMSGAQGEQASTSTEAVPASLPAQPPNHWRPYPQPTFAHGIPVPPGIQHPNPGPFPMMGPHGWMPNHAPFGINQQAPSNVSVGSGSAHMQPMFEQRNYNVPPRRQHRRDNQSNFKNGGRGHPGRYPRGSFAPNVPMMNAHPAPRPDHFTSSQRDVQSHWPRMEPLG
ncbi:hypothetical protein DEU56DRAFT_847357 [Suillus clintonianus]|uniref:uncharacterized protein n=1 Tax=Suillus clintonianus TaxID=1904413 RepID=UPI001B876117|nr:uncharacterized protein DEU56DRAFT_847357 [Suillus clintonianus]KAG2155623.1 hypothetical protein DEU56DRAFT_847357 [Suillus clintonianus]